jgi:hypothetical protein
VQALNYSAALHTSLLLLGISFLVLAATYGLRRRVWAVWPPYGNELSVDIRKRHAGGPEIAAALRCHWARIR